ncbi:MAG TPA: HEAT repeat domain-containing protein [Thermoanaerobaculia bacterium]|nr:HEAT repeat domain-containing protein [Thermoanaerobaculia bacterium]
MRIGLLLLAAIFAAPMEAEEILTLGCSVACAPDPQTKWDYPDCEEYAFNDVLIRALEGGDRSAGELLASRYATTFTLPERHRITAALSRNGKDIAANWEELAADAANAVHLRSVAGDDTKLIAYCRERGCDPLTYYNQTAMHALGLAMADPRSRPLLLEALETDDKWLISTAVSGFGEQRDESALPLIEQRLERLPKDDRTVAWALLTYGSENADRLALRNLSEEDGIDYRNTRAALDAAPPAAARP